MSSHCIPGCLCCSDLTAYYRTGHTRVHALLQGIFITAGTRCFASCHTAHQEGFAFHGVFFTAERILRFQRDMLTQGAGKMTAVNAVPLERSDYKNLTSVKTIAVSGRKGEVESARMSEAQVDQLLVERVQKGDKKAFDLLINKYQHRIISLVARYVKDQTEALDVAQEAFIKAYRAIGNFRGDSAFYTWLYRIAINTAKNWLVAQKRRPPASDIDAVDAEQYDIESRLKDRATPENELLREEIKKTVYDTIAELPDDLRTAIMLREMEGMSYDEIATTMECPIGTVRSRIFRAREAIDNQLRPLIEGP